MSELRPGTVIAGKYELRERLTGGGMGAVWKAHHAQLDAPIAIKVMHPSEMGRQDAAARFEREAKASARIRSPYVVHVTDHGVDEATGMPFIAMELLEGEDLQHRLRRVRRLSLSAVSAICEQVCKGLGRAHEIGIVHRDLKPSNVFLCAPDDEVVKLLDFGIAKETGQRRLVGSETTTPGQVLGTPHYMSPEQARGQRLDPRSDLWSLAVILFRALAGKRPFDASDFGDLVVKICSEPVPPATSIEPSLPSAVDRFFERAFERDRERRFQSAEELARAFAAVVSADEAKDEEETLPVTARESRVSDVGTAPVSTGAPMQIVHRPSRPMVAPERPSHRVTVMAVGVIIAVALVLFVARRPGEFTLGAVPAVFEEAARRFEEAVNGKPVPTGVMPAESASAAEKKRAAEAAWRELYRQARTGEIPMAVETLALLTELDPEGMGARRRTLSELAAKALVRPDETKQRMVDLLTEGMGPYGPDILFEVARARQGPAAAVAAKMLEDRPLRERGSEDMRLAYDIRKAPPCGKKARIAKAEAAGGDLVLREIRALTERCAPGQPCCLAKDESVAAVVRAIAARSKHSGASDAGPDASSGASSPHPQER